MYFPSTSIKSTYVASLNIKVAEHLMRQYSHFFSFPNGLNTWKFIEMYFAEDMIEANGETYKLLR